MKTKSFFLTVAFLLLAVPGYTSQTVGQPRMLAWDDNGDPEGMCLYTFNCGLSTSKTTYTTKALAVAHTNPVQATGRGEFPQIYFEGCIKVALANPDAATGNCLTFANFASADVEWTQDNYYGEGVTVLDFLQLSDYTSLDNALDTIGATETELWGDDDSTLTEAEVFPATMKYRALTGNIIDLGNFNLTINGTFTAPNSQVFNESGTGAVTFGPGAVEYVLMEWWGTNAAAFQNAVNCAIASDVPLKGLAASYTIESPITVSGNFNWFGSGDYSGATNYIYTGSCPFIKTTAKLDNLRWEGFRVSTTGNANTNVDIFDFDYGTKQSSFKNIYMDLTAAARDSWVIRGQPAAGGAANNWQYENHWERCRVGGSSGAAATGDGWQCGTEITSGRCNANTWVGCTSGDDGLGLIFNIAGNGNRFLNCNWQNTTGAAASPYNGNYYGLFYGDTTYKNTFFGCYFDGDESVLFNSDALVDSDADGTYNAQAPAEFYFCAGINYSKSTAHTAPSSTVHDYEADGTSTVCLANACTSRGARIVVEDSRQHWNINTFAGDSSRGYDKVVGRSGSLVIVDDNQLDQSGDRADCDTIPPDFCDDWDGDGSPDTVNYASLFFGRDADAGLFRNAANDLRTVNGDSFRITKGFGGYGVAVALTLDTNGDITVTSSNVTVATFGAAASDDLDTISGGTTGDCIWVRAADSTHTVVIKDYVGGSDNIYCGTDRTLDNSRDRAQLCQFSFGEWSLTSFWDNDS